MNSIENSKTLWAAFQTARQKYRAALRAFINSFSAPSAIREREMSAAAFAASQAFQESEKAYRRYLGQDI